ncbi:Wall-associated receptor kinase, C-terminal [Sesbania bispinosa]|nr:Wall-associated receptor kinase, C-terminal [Sesbania bispinosa]
MASLLILLPPIPILILQFIILLILIQIPPYLSSDDYRVCSNNLFSCGGNITNIGFPFWGGDRPDRCGHPLLHLTCEGNISYITIKDVKYKVLEANPKESTLRITRVDYLYFEGLCPSKLVNTTLDTKLFVYGSDSEYKNLTLFYGCPASNPFSSPAIGRLPCFTNGDFGEFVYTQFGSFGPPLSCKESVVVPVSPLWIDINDFIKTQEAIRAGFVVRWIAGIEQCENCKKSGGGVCGYDGNSNQTTCYYCNDQSCSNFSPDTKAPPSTGKSSSNKVGIVIGVVAGVAALVGILCCVCFMVRRKRRIAKQSTSKDLLMHNSSSVALTSTTNSSQTQSVSSYPSSKSGTVPRSYYFGVQVFTYDELDEATKNFHTSRELGEGGFGTVYKGELKDGRVVAVKRHYESNFKRVEQFMNEVEILARLRHKNLVTLYGCTSRQSRELLLVYEFIPNGTVADHLHGTRSKSALLPWPNQELHELVDPYIGFEKDPAVRRMTTAVAELAFRCLQQQRDMRPSMDEVLEILRAIKSDELDTREAKVVDVRTDELVLLKKVPSPVSPDSVADHKWVSGSSTSTSYSS